MPEKHTNAASRSRTNASREKYCGFVLIVGLLIEISTLFIFPDGRSCEELLLNGMAYIMVFIGVFGEIYFASRTRSADEELKRDAGKLIEELKLKAEEARERAEILKAEASWRSIGNEEIGAIKLSLDGSGIPASIWLVILANDPESFHFAQQISIPFRAAGWNIGFRFESYSEGIFTGLMLPEYDNCPEDTKIVNGRVKDALIAATMMFINGWPSGVYFTHATPSALAVPVAWMYVGPKPRPRL